MQQRKAHCNFDTHSCSHDCCLCRVRVLGDGRVLVEVRLVWRGAARNLTRALMLQVQERRYLRG